uniref:Uncharacterized protein n=1 Tax=Pseudomonas fluorescens TaxID=294 RepID=Q8VPK5_PSEFL|nr:unknown [Pseudomonas fluorescens]
MICCPWGLRFTGKSCRAGWLRVAGNHPRTGERFVRVHEAAVVISHTWNQIKPGPTRQL